MLTLIEKKLKSLKHAKERIDLRIKNLEKQRDDCILFSDKEISLFLKVLKQHNFRDYVVAQVIIETGVRITSVLRLEKDNINFEDKTITFIYSNETVYKKISESLLHNLKILISLNDTHFIFVTTKNRLLTRSRINFIFKEISDRAHISKKNIFITPELLRIYKPL